jgi:RIP metalloprotease RseP
VNAFWIAIGVFVLGLMVLVHEWGHFIVARFFGVRVDTFSIGFGPRLFGLRRGPTDYRLSALPLGGYVKMAGDNPLVEREGAPDEFLSKPPALAAGADCPGRSGDEHSDGYRTADGPLFGAVRAACVPG